MFSETNPTAGKIEHPRDKVNADPHVGTAKLECRECIRKWPIRQNGTKDSAKDLRADFGYIWDKRICSHRFRLVNKAF